MMAFLGLLVVVVLVGRLVMLSREFRARRQLAQFEAWRREHDRREQAKGNPDQIPWKWPVIKGGRGG